MRGVVVLLALLGCSFGLEAFGLLGGRIRGAKGSSGFPCRVLLTLTRVLCAAGQRGQLQNNSHVMVLLQAGFGHVAVPAAYLTFFPLAGSQLVGLSFLSVKDNKTSLTTPGVVGKAWSGCGPLECSDRLNGGVAETMLETGVFYSEDARTHLLMGDPRKTLSNGLVRTLWDHEQLRGFGLSHFGNVPLYQKAGWLSSEYEGAGSPVAGPDAYYKNDNRGTVLDISHQGPWKRIASTGSRAAKDSRVRPVAPYRISEGEIVDAAEWTEETSVGEPLSEKEPLPPHATALRIATGKIEAGKHVFVALELLVTDAKQFSAAVRARRAHDAPCAVVFGVANAGAGGEATANPWKGYNETGLFCDELDDLLPLETASWSITALALEATCDGSRDGSVYLATNGAQAPLAFQWSDGISGTSPQRHNMTNGKYRVTIVDANGDSNYEDVMVGTKFTPMGAKVVARGRGDGMMGVRVQVRNGQSIRCKWNRTGIRECNLTSVDAAEGRDVVTVVDGFGCFTTLNLTAASFVEPFALRVEAFVRGAICESLRTMSRLVLVLKGGAAPYVARWRHVDAAGSVMVGEGSELTNVKPGELSFNVSDTFGTRFSRKLLVSATLEVTWADNSTRETIVTTQDNPKPLNMQLILVSHVPCHGQTTGRVRVNFTGGVPPYSFYSVSKSPKGVAKVEGYEIWSGGGVIQVKGSDSTGCRVEGEIEVFPALPFQVTLSWTNTHQRSWNYYNVTVGFSNGIPPFVVLWNHIRAPEMGVSPLTFVPAGKYYVTGMDHMECVSTLEFVLPEEQPQLCPELELCMAKMNWHHSFFTTCLRAIAEPLLWDPSKWDLCQARAAFELLKRLHVSFNTIGITTVDHGAMFLANLLGEALHRCETERGSEACDFPWALLTPYFHEAPAAAAAFRAKDFKGVFRVILQLNDTSPVDVLTLAPFGYDNDPVFAPQLAIPHKLSVATLLVNHVRFPSSLVRTAVYPWTLQVDVELGAMFLKHALEVLQPKFVFPSDNAAILLIHKLGSRAEQGDASLASLVPLFQRSNRWPTEYPPESVSKLMPGHAEFAPRELVVSECDGLHCATVDHSRVADAFQFLGPRTYLKREFSEASRGVAHIAAVRDIPAVVASVFARQDGIGVMDRSLRVRLFLQEGVMGSAEPLGARFFAVGGRVLAMALSQLHGWADRVALRYRTARNADVESKTIAFVRAINYTGFASAWWWPTEANASCWKLIDFNARIERHACLGGVLQGAEQNDDPCVVFQRYARGEKFADDAPVAIVPAGITYLDPIRLSDVLDPVWGERLNNYSEWNVARQDTLLMERVRRLNMATFELTVVRKPTFVRWTDAIVRVNVTGGLAPHTCSLRNVRSELGSALITGTHNFTGLVPGHYQLVCKDSRRVEVEARVRVGDDALYGTCRSLLACSSLRMTFEDKWSFVRCVVPTAMSAFAPFPVWDDCAMRALMTLQQLDVFEEGGLARKFLALVFERVMKTNSRGLHTAHGFNDKLDFKAEFMDILGLKAERRLPDFRSKILGFGLSSDTRNTQAVAFIPTLSGAPHLMLSPVRPASSSRVVWIRFPPEFAAEAKLASLFLAEVKRVLDVSHVIPTDELAHFVGSGHQLQAFENEARIRVVSEYDGVQSVGFDAKGIRVAWKELGKANTVLRREHAPLRDAISLPVERLSHRRALEYAFAASRRESGGIGMLSLTQPLRLFVEAVDLKSRVERRTFFFFAQGGQLLAGHLVQHLPGKKFVTVDVMSSSIYERTESFIHNMSFSGFGSCEWWGPDGPTLTSAHMVQFRPYLRRNQCLSDLVATDNSLANPCHVFANFNNKKTAAATTSAAKKEQRYMQAVPGSLSFYSASAFNAVRFAFDDQAVLNLPQRDAEFAEDLATRAKQIVLERLIRPKTLSK